MGTVANIVNKAGIFIGGTLQKTFKSGLKGSVFGFAPVAVLGGAATWAVTAVYLSTLTVAAPWILPVALMTYAASIVPAVAGGLFNKIGTALVTSALGVGASLLAPFLPIFAPVAIGLFASAAAGVLGSSASIMGAKIGAVFGALTGGVQALNKHGQSTTKNLEQELTTAQHRRMQAENRLHQTIDAISEQGHDGYIQQQRNGTALAAANSAATSRSHEADNNPYASFDNPYAQDHAPRYHVEKYIENREVDNQAEYARVR